MHEKEESPFARWGGPFPRAAIGGSASRFVFAALLLLAGHRCWAQAAYYFSASGVNFGSEPVGSTTAASTLTFKFTSGGNLGSTPVGVLTQGATGQDFADAGTGTCTTQGSVHTYATNDTCTVNVTFTPKHPGTRLGAVVLYDGSHAVIATGYVYGAGTGPVLTFAPFTQSTLTSSISNPEGMAVDGNGNLFVAANSDVYELAYSSGTYGAPSDLLNSYGGTSLSATQWVTVDGAGNVLVADGNNGRVLKLSPGSSGGYSASEVCSSACNGNEIAADGSGNLYTLSAATGAIVQLTLQEGGGYTRSTISLADSNNPWSIIVDAAGDIFYSTQGDGCLREIPYGGSDTQLDCSLNSPQGMAIDLTGNLYFTETVGDVVEYTLSGGVYTEVSTPLVTGLSNDTGLWVDANDNLFVSDTGNNLVYKFDYADPPTLSFASTQVGAASSSNPQTVTIVNAGNAALVLPHPGSGTNPSFSAGFDYDNASTCDTISSSYTVAAGASCTLAVDFDPVAVGSPVTGTATLTDDSLNVTGGTQSIPLTGTATQGSQTLAFTNPGTQTVGAPLTLAGSASSGLTVSYASSTTGVCTVSSGTATFLTSGTCTITASQAGNANYSAAASVTQSFTVNAASQTITFASPGTQTVGTPLTLSASASSGLTVSYASSTTGVCTVSGSTATFLTSGTCTITASQAGNSSYNSASSVSRSFTVNGEAQTITFTAPSSPVTYGASPVTLTASASSGLSVAFSVLSGPGTIAGSTLTITGGGTIMVAANQAGSAAYAAAMAVTRSIVVSAATPTITWATPSAITYGTSLGGALSAAATFGSGSVAGSYAYTAGIAGLSATAVTGATVLPAGSYTLNVTFTPANTTDYTTATRSVTLTVAQAASAITLVSSIGTILTQNPITFTATVSSSSGTPGGTVNFLDGSTVLGSSSLSSGVATFTTSSLPIGTDTVTAVYAGSGNYAGSTSAGVTETIQDFNLTLSTSSGSTTAVTAAPGQTAVYLLIMSPVGATVFPAQVVLSASGLPSGATASFSPASLSAGSGTTTVTMSIALPQQSAALPANRPNSFRGLSWPSFGPIALGMCLLPFARRLRRLGQRLSIALLLVSGSVCGLAGCGTRSSGFFAQQSQTYTITVTGTSGALVHSTTVSLTVQ